MSESEAVADEKLVGSHSRCESAVSGELGAGQIKRGAGDSVGALEVEHDGVTDVCHGGSRVVGESASANSHSVLDLKFRTALGEYVHPRKTN